MIKAVIVYIVLVCTAIKASGSNILLYEKANQMYHNQMYAQAAQLYSQMIDEGYSSANVFYNSGNAFFKLKKFGTAVWCYEKALMIDANFKNAKDNLMVTRTQLKLSPNAKEIQPVVLRFLNRIHSTNGWFVGAFLFLTLYSIAYIFRKFKKNHPMLIILRKLSIVGFVIYIVTGSTVYLYQRSLQYAINIFQSELYRQPNKQTQSIVKLSEGEKLRIIDASNQLFYKVSNGQHIGYIAKANVKKL